MIIKKFAKLCDCNPQTLRYYDSINLLKPVKVDEYTGYRYYSPEQALDYLKIKKLQDAHFTIEEIKKLLNQTDAVIYKALEEKIKEEENKLKEIIEIQKSYQNEMREMREKINEFRVKMMKGSEEIDFKKQFGLSEEEYFLQINKINEILEGINEIEFDSEEEVFPSENLTLVYECVGFKTIKEAINKMPYLENKTYFVVVSVDEDFKDNYAYCCMTTNLCVEKFKDGFTDGKIDFKFEAATNLQSFKLYEVN